MTEGIKTERALPKRVLMAGLFHETHTFLEGHTRLEDCEVLCGAQMLNSRGDSSPLGGALEVAGQCGWEILPAIDLRAMPGPLVEDGVLCFLSLIHI